MHFPLITQQHPVLPHGSSQDPGVLPGAVACLTLRKPRVWQKILVLRGPGFILSWKPHLCFAVPGLNPGLVIQPSVYHWATVSAWPPSSVSFWDRVPLNHPGWMSTLLPQPLVTGIPEVCHWGNSCTRLDPISKREKNIEQLAIESCPIPKGKVWELIVFPEARRGSPK